MARVVIWAFSNFSHLNFFHHPIQYFKDSMMNSVLCGFPLTPSHVLDNWEKCMLTPLSWLVTLSGPGQDGGPSAPSSWTIWFESRDFQSWVMDQWSASDLAFSSFFFFFLPLMVSVCVYGGVGGCWESSRTWPTSTNKEVTAGNKWVWSLWVTFAVRLNASWWFARAERNHFTQHMLWT